jgi:hypothetical protein
MPVTRLASLSPSVVSFQVRPHCQPATIIVGATWTRTGNIPPVLELKGQQLGQQVVCWPQRGAPTLGSAVVQTPLTLRLPAAVVSKYVE